MAHLEAVQREDRVRIDVVGCRWKVRKEKLSELCDGRDERKLSWVESRPEGWN